MKQTEQLFFIGIDYPAQLNAYFWSGVVETLTELGVEVDVDEVNNIATISGPRSVFVYALLTVVGLECADAGMEGSPIFDALTAAVVRYRMELDVPANPAQES